MGFLRRLFGGDRPGPGREHEHADLDVEAPGWDAIDAALAPVYGDQEPKHYGTIIKFALGGPDPLDGVSVYENPGPPAHWHYVGYGLSELYTKESEDPELSGWGIELTFRLVRGSDREPPTWPISLMQNLARYVFETGAVLWPNHHMDANGPIAQESKTALHALLCARDPELGEISTPHGRLTFVQLIGITLDELAAVKAWNSAAFLGLWRERNPLLVTDLDRSSLLEDPAFAEEVAARTAAEGSSLAGLNVDVLRWAAAEGSGAVRVTFGAYAIEGVADLLRRRVARGLAAWIESADASLQLDPADEWAISTDEALLTIAMPAAAALALADALRPTVGTYETEEAPGLVVEVEETILRDSTGAEIGRVG
ncbi:MAG TPA: suppressor of fused domain protein [Candidatus Limnocylindrales bacterium]|nr:suppressor of fused domain protein [Candidatus Limnocylindrales bacterium]